MHHILRMQNARLMGTRPPRPLPAPREQISYLDAILGNDNVNVEVVDGSVEIKVPQGCQPETVLRIRGKGAPQLNNASVSLVVGDTGLLCRALSLSSSRYLRTTRSVDRVGWQGEGLAPGGRDDTSTHTSSTV